MRCGGNEREIRFRRFDVSGMLQNHRRCSYLGSVSLTSTHSRTLFVREEGII